MATTRKTATRDQHRRILKRRGGPCGICGQPIDYSLPYLHPMSFVADHIVPWVKGGPDTLENKQSVHRRCNRDKADVIDYDPASKAVPTIKHVRAY